MQVQVWYYKTSKGLEFRMRDPKGESRKEGQTGWYTDRGTAKVCILQFYTHILECGEDPKQTQWITDHNALTRDQFKSMLSKEDFAFCAMIKDKSLQALSGIAEYNPSNKQLDKRKVLLTVNKGKVAAHACSAFIAKRKGKEVLVKGCIKNAHKLTNEERNAMHHFMAMYNKIIKQNNKGTAQLVRFQDWLKTTDVTENTELMEEVAATPNCYGQRVFNL